MTELKIVVKISDVDFRGVYFLLFIIFNAWGASNMNLTKFLSGLILSMFFVVGLNAKAYKAQPYHIAECWVEIYNRPEVKSLSSKVEALDFSDTSKANKKEMFCCLKQIIEVFDESSQVLSKYCSHDGVFAFPNLCKTDGFQYQFGTAIRLDVPEAAIKLNIGFFNIMEAISGESVYSRGLFLYRVYLPHLFKKHWKSIIATTTFIASVAAFNVFAQKGCGGDYKEALLKLKDLSILLSDKLHLPELAKAAKEKGVVLAGKIKEQAPVVAAATKEKWLMYSLIVWAKILQIYASTKDGLSKVHDGIDKKLNDDANWGSPCNSTYSVLD